MADPNVRRVVLDHIAIRVRDLAASRRFYEAALAALDRVRFIVEVARMASRRVQGDD